MRPLTALAGLTGAAMLVNRRLRTTSELPHDHVGGTRLRWNWRGHELFATEMGDGPPILLIHGLEAGASSFEFRRLAPLLARAHRVIAFDFLGCGLSPMPDLAYTVDLFVDQIVDALAEFAQEPVTLVGRSLGAAFAIRAASRAADRVGRLVTICPTGLGGILDEEPRSAQRPLAMLLHAPVIGETTFNGLASMTALRRTLRTQLYAQPASVTDEVVRHYYAVTHQPGARFVPAQRIGGLLNCDIARDLPFVAAPVLVLWGELASNADPLSKAAEYVRLAKDGRLVTFAHSGLLPHEEEPEATAAAIETFSAKGAHVA
ncbi:MAG TPA: alpha/beta fold hydrolase [Candidatus Acidoferrales bacterium]|nr:alpha/beta fold hydrolase [Candidatus Acidoferrales bacterium]